jgi:hypothetical protein
MAEFRKADRSNFCLGKARKYGAHFCLSNQFTDQIATAVRSAVLGNAGTLIVFRISGTDAKLLAPEFHPIEANALADQLPFSAWLRRAAFPAISRSKPRRLWRSRADGWRLS